LTAAARAVKPIVARVLDALAALMSSLIVGSVLTLWLLPLWRWIEATTGIESIGHCGPADRRAGATRPAAVSCRRAGRPVRVRRDAGH
jgi:hypothetical protein